MIRYKKYQNLNEANESTYKKWFARAVAEDTVDLNKLAEHMSKHHTPYSQGCIRGVLRDMVDCVKELVLDGKNVKIDDLAIFSVGISTQGANTAAEFTHATNIKKCTLRCRPTGNLRPTTMVDEVQYREYGEYVSGGTTKKEDSPGQ